MILNNNYWTRSSKIVSWFVSSELRSVFWHPQITDQIIIQLARQSKLQLVNFSVILHKNI